MEPVAATGFPALVVTDEGEFGDAVHVKECKLQLQTYVTQSRWEELYKITGDPLFNPRKASRGSESNGGPAKRRRVQADDSDEWARAYAEADKASTSEPPTAEPEYNVNFCAVHAYGLLSVTEDGKTLQTVIHNIIENMIKTKASFYHVVCEVYFSYNVILRSQPECSAPSHSDFHMEVRKPPLWTVENIVQYLSKFHGCRLMRDIAEARRVTMLVATNQMEPARAEAWRKVHQYTCSLEGFLKTK